MSCLIALVGTSKTMGVGPRQVWHAVVASALARTGSPMPRGVETYLSEIAWREFSYHLLFHFPDLPTRPLRTEFSSFDWHNNADDLSAWQRGSTGYPIAGFSNVQLGHSMVKSLWMVCHRVHVTGRAYIGGLLWGVNRS